MSADTDIAVDESRLLRASDTFTVKKQTSQKMERIMIILGKRQKLTIVQTVDFGVY